MTRNMMQCLFGTRVPSSGIVSRGWAKCDAYRELNRLIIEAHSFIDDTDRILSRHEQVERVLPEVDDLEKQGVDIAALADGLTNGLSAKAFAKGLSSGLDVRLFFLALDRGQLDLQAVNEGLVRYGTPGISRLNEGLDHLDDLYLDSPRHRAWAESRRRIAS